MTDADIAAELDFVRSLLDDLAERRLLCGFSAVEADHYERLSAEEARLLEGNQQGGWPTSR